MTTPASTHVVFKDDPGGGGCDANGNCGSGGVNNGPGGTPGGQGCVNGRRLRLRWPERGSRRRAGWQRMCCAAFAAAATADPLLTSGMHG